MICSAPPADPPEIETAATSACIAETRPGTSVSGESAATTTTW
jgi:hypothetical protein